MNYEDLRSYIFQYIRQFSPYKDTEFYQVLVSFLEEIYLKDSYTVTPEQFKILFEEHTLNVHLYDIVLRSLGFPRTLIESLPSTHKQILLNDFSDYNNRKGTLRLIREISAAFNDPINIYELYIDFRLLNSTWDWWFIPRELYRNVDRAPVPKLYDFIYNSTPTYYVSKQQFHNWFLAEQISLPIKSNLIMLSMSNETAADEMSIMTMMTSLHYFKDENVNVTMRNGIYEVSLIGLYQLWHYLLAYHRGEINSTQVDGEIVYFDISGATFYYTLEEGLPNSIKTIQEEYDALLETDEIWAFHKKYIEDVFKKVAPTSISDLTTLRKSLLYSVDIDLINYIETQLETATDIETEIVSIMQEIRESIVVHILNNEDDLMHEYKEDLLNAFELSIIVPDKTTTYKLIDFIKPFHTQIVAERRQIISNRSKFNNAGILDHYRMFVIRDYRPTICAISDDVYFCERIEGQFTLSATNEILTTIDIIALFAIGDQLFIRPQDLNGYSDPIPDDIYSLEHLTTIVDIVQIGESEYWNIVIESPYTGIIGLFNATYKRYHLLQS